MVINWQNLTEKQKLVYDLYYNQQLTQLNIAHRLNISQPAVNKHLRKIKEKLPNEAFIFHRLYKSEVVPPCHHSGTTKKYYRYHNLHLVIKPYKTYPRWANSIGYLLYKGIWTIKVNSSNIEVFTNKDITHGELEGCLDKFRQELIKVVNYLETRIGCEILKTDKLNIKIVRQHLAEVNNGVATDCNTTLKIEDHKGELRVVIDFSTGAPELEGVHGIKAVEDIQELKRHLSVMYLEDIPTVADLSKFLGITFNMIEQQAKATEQIAKTLKDLMER